MNLDCTVVPMPLMIIVDTEIHQSSNEVVSERLLSLDFALTLFPVTEHNVLRC